MDFSLRLIGPGEPDDVVAKFKKLLSSGFWMYAMAAIIETRSYYQGLEFVERLELLNRYYKSTWQISQRDYESHDCRLIFLRLQLYDRLDMWAEYVEYFEQTRQETAYHLMYADREEDAAFASYVLWRGDRIKHVHFLYGQDYRYEIIKKKLAKLRDGKKVGNLLHRPQAELSPEEIEERFNRIIDAAEHGQPIFAPY